VITIREYLGNNIRRWLEMETKVVNPKIFILSGGFYIFGNEIQSSTVGYVVCNQAAMFRGFGGGKGLPGVARGDKEATVKLDTFIQDQELFFPEENLIAIVPSINLYQFEGAQINA